MSVLTYAAYITASIQVGVGGGGGLEEVGGFLMILPHRKLIDGPPQKRNPRLIMTSVLAAVFYGAASHNLNKCHLTFHRFVEPFQL